MMIKIIPHIEPFAICGSGLNIGKYQHFVAVFFKNYWHSVPLDKRCASR